MSTTKRGKGFHVFRANCCLSQRTDIVRQLPVSRTFTGARDKQQGMGFQTKGRNTYSKIFTVWFRIGWCMCALAWPSYLFPSPLPPCPTFNSGSQISPYDHRRLWPSRKIEWRQDWEDEISTTTYRDTSVLNSTYASTSASLCFHFLWDCVALYPDIQSNGWMKW